MKIATLTALVAAVSADEKFLLNVNEELVNFSAAKAKAEFTDA